MLASWAARERPRRYAEYKLSNDVNKKLGSAKHEAEQDGLSVDAPESPTCSLNFFDLLSVFFFHLMSILVRTCHSRSRCINNIATGPLRDTDRYCT